MTDKQPDALNIAKRLKNQQQPLSLALREKAAAELRRLHEENEQIKHAIRLSGLTLIATAKGMRLTCLGEVEAQGENNDT